MFLRNALKRFQAFRSSPRTWGCFPCALRFISRRPVFPTHVGVFLSERFRGQVRKRLPHARGGVSDTGHVTPFSSRVFPTHVGVFLLPHTRCACSVRLPHARGGVSLLKASSHKVSRSSPRTWGCFFHLPALRTSGDVFPTHVGVFLGSAPRGLLLFCLPHARGGVSACRPSRPRHAGLPHARGGVSSSTSEVHGKGLSSPRTWGCFTLGAGLSGFGIVFPTHVGGGRQAGVAPESPFPTVGAFHVCP